MGLLRFANCRVPLGIVGLPETRRLAAAEGLKSFLGVPTGFEVAGHPVRLSSR